MKVVVIDNNFRAYWNSRLEYLQSFLRTRNIQLSAIELFGKDAPHAFSKNVPLTDWRTCLFPGNSANEVSRKDIRKSLFAVLDTVQPDVIIATPIVFYAGALGLRWARQRGKKFIMSEDAKPAQFKRNPVVQWVKDTLIAQADGLWLPSADYYEDYARFHRSGIHFIYGCNTIDNRHFAPPAPGSFTHKTIICVARLVPLKNVDNLLHAWKIVEQQHTGYRLLIVGNGPEEENLRQLTTALNLTTVEFAGGVSNRELPGYYHGADAFILPSLSETWGLVVNEAMAAGLPVLLSRQVNAGRTLLKEGINGFSFDPLQPAGIAASILQFIGLSPAKKSLMSGASLSIIGDMDYEHMSKQLLEALLIIHQQKPRPVPLLASLLLRLWPGKYNTAVWDKLK